MSTSLYISTIEAGSGKSMVSLGVIEYALRKTTRVGFFRPVIHEPAPGKRDEDIDLILRHFWLPQPYDASYAWFDHDARRVQSALDALAVGVADHQHRRT